MADAPVFAFAVVGHARIGAARPFRAGAAPGQKLFAGALDLGLLGCAGFVHVAHLRARGGVGRYRKASVQQKAPLEGGAVRVAEILLQLHLRGDQLGGANFHLLVTGVAITPFLSSNQICIFFPFRLATYRSSLPLMASAITIHPTVPSVAFRRSVRRYSP